MIGSIDYLDDESIVWILFRYYGAKMSEKALGKCLKALGAPRGSSLITKSVMGRQLYFTLWFMRLSGRGDGVL